MPSHRPSLILLMTLTAGVIGACRLYADDVVGDPAAYFDARIAPIFAAQCAECHNDFDRKGGLDLTNAKAARRGGDSGDPIAHESIETSLLLQRLESGEMPPDEPLPPDTIETIKRWIEGGAKWGTSPIDTFQFSNDRRAGRDWWSLQPLTSPQPPTSPFPQRVQNPIDNFVHARLAAAGLTPSAAADKRTLIRRLSFDLLGLPPTRDQVAEFIADNSDQAYSRLVRRMLNSSHYGERWARHWLDVARYGESDGFEYDRLRPNAWRYRDWVISALNQDMPFDRFAAWQIAGDILSPGDPDAITATGFLVCGAFDGLIPQGDVMKKVMRQDTLEDFVGTISQTFLGMTTNCARCHDHKFDPIKQSEYYRLTAAVASVTHGNRTVVPNRQALHVLKEQQQQMLRERRQIQATASEQFAASDSSLELGPVAAYDFALGIQDQVGGESLSLRGGAAVVSGQLQLNGHDSFAASSPLRKSMRAKTLEVWVQLATLAQQGGSAISLQTLDGNVFDAIVYGERQGSHWMAGSEGFFRTQSFGGEPEVKAAKQLVHLVITYAPDGEVRAYRDGQPYGKPYMTTRPYEFDADNCQLVFGLRHGTSVVADRMLAGGIARARLFDRVLTAAEVRAAARVEVPSHAAWIANLPPEKITRLEELNSLINELQTRIENHPTFEVYAAVPTTPEATHVLIRGNPQSPAEQVAAGGIAAIGGVNGAFGVAADAPDEQRRKALADWVTSPRNPLFARVIVNRVWHYHFARGIVKTPNDFGFNGGLPSHPELLDWLAGRLQSNGWSLKELHFLIVTSATYQQNSRIRSSAMSVDADDRLLWRFPSRRMDAEVIRDSILQVAGQLNSTVGGPPYRDVRPYEHRGAQFYEPLDPIGEAFHRRSIYRLWARGGRNAWLDAFDCPDPSSTAPQRAVTTTPLQALAMLNNSFVLRMANQLAERLETEAGEKSEPQVRLLYQYAFAREAAVEEIHEAQAFVEHYGLPAFCRVVLNSNEFLSVE